MGTVSEHGGMILPCHTPVSCVYFRKERERELTLSNFTSSAWRSGLAFVGALPTLLCPLSSAVPKGGAWMSVGLGQ